MHAVMGGAELDMLAQPSEQIVAERKQVSASLQ